MRRHYTSTGSRYDAFEEQSPLDLTRDPADNMRELLHNITSKNEMSTTKRMGYINNFTKLIQNFDEKTNFGYCMEDIIKCLQVPLTMPAKEVRAAGVRALRHLFSDKTTFEKMLKVRMDIFIIRSMDNTIANEVERIQALRFIRKVVAVCPKSCPMSLAVCLVSTGSDNSEEPDRLKTACLATLCELAIKNSALASYSGGINAIIRNVLDCQVPRLNEALMVTLLFLLNNSDSRPYVRSDVGLEGVLAPFTDLHYRHNADTSEKLFKEDREARLRASEMAIIAVFRSWSGIISFCKPDGKGLQSLLGVFCLNNSEVRRGIMDIISQIFRIKQAVWTDDFNIALMSVDPSVMQDTWRLQENFVAQEGKDLLPHRATGRTNLVSNYTALVLAAFMNAGLLECLVEVITSSDCFISVQATILLGELLHLANTLLPPECSRHSHCLPSLVNTATSFEVSAAERGRASAAVNCLDRLHQMKKREPVPCSLYLEQIFNQANTLEPKVKPDKSHKERLLQCLSKDPEDADVAAIRDTQVATEKDFRKWDWELIGATLQSPSLSLKKLEETNNQRFIRNLLYFYKPSSQQFCTVSITDNMAKTYSRAGLLLIDFLLDTDDAAGDMILKELTQEIGECLLEVLSPNMTGVLSSSSLQNTLSRDYILFLGRISCSKNSTSSKLLEKTDIYQYLLEMCSTPGQENLLKLIIASLDYKDTGISRIILSKLLTASSVSTRLYATSHMRVLLRSKVLFFNNWGMEFLVTQLYDTETQVANEAADVLDEACEDEANLQYLVQLRPVLLHLGERGIRLMTRFVAVERGFTYLQSLGYLHVLLEQWRQKFCREYVRWVEELLAESLTTYTKATDEESYVRRSTRRKTVKDCFLPPHLYGKLVQKKNGFKLLQKTNDIELCVRTIQTLEPDTREKVIEIKAALWALGHCGSSNWGITLLMEEDVIPDIVRMAEESENFAIRGTCFYVLGLIAKTRQGADILQDLEWESIRHMGEEQWPVLDSRDQIIPTAVNPPLTPAYTAFNLGKITETSDSGIYTGEEPKKGPDSSTAYDELSGIYLGEEKTTTKKPPRDDRSDSGGILARWFEEAERRRKIATRESGLYDDASGVYLGDDNKTASHPLIEPEGLVPGGIMARLLQDSGLSKPDAGKKESSPKLSHRRNRSDGNFIASGLVPTTDLKRRAVSNVDQVMSGHEFKADDDDVLEMKHRHSPTTTSSESLHIGAMFNSAMKSTAETEPEVARAGDENVVELTIPVGHVRSNSSVSSCCSEGSIEYQEVSHSRHSSSTSEATSYQNSPANYPGDFGSDDTQASVARPIPVQGEKFGPALSSVASSSSTQDNAPAARLRTSYESPLPSPQLLHPSRGTAGEAEPRDVTRVKDEGHQILQRQRSISLTEKRRTKSPTLSLLSENRSSSFHGSTEFSKISSKRCHSSDEDGLPRGTNISDDFKLLSNNSLAEVKILSDKTIVFRSGAEKERSISFDSSHVSDLRRDRLLVTGSQSENDPDSWTFKGRSRTESCEKAELARRLGLKSGDLTRSFGRTRGMSSGYASDGYRRKKVMNRNSLFWNNENITVISGDSNKNARNILDTSAFTSARDASGYVALSSLRRLRSFGGDLEASYGSTYKPLAGGSGAQSPSMEMPYTQPRDSLGSSSSSYEFRQLSSSVQSSSAITEFLGLCLPLNLSVFFQVEDYDFQGSWADHFIPDPQCLTLPSHPIEPDNLPMQHDPSRCLGCIYSKRSKSMNERRKSTDSVSDPEKISICSLTVDTSSGGSNYTSTEESSAPAGKEGEGVEEKNLDESSQHGRAQIRKEVLRLVVTLSSAVGSKSHQEGLLKLKARFPHIFQDLCMLCEVADLMSIYQFRLSIRRFIFTNIFDDVIFTEITDYATNIANGDISSSGC
ncbi:rapamycin-insensitive companion of mTOR isoform X2 [Nematostella vectensis]|uniref:rapamycin-insensitive companion of mTOR isoform X2 n=1 Tax=Nematostella vectensis TaxID=45351 RepID=UPI00207756E7|nr:rapamycin-insensitive companion of mTOR isoform X2 [Nematostella vectensis]